MTIMCPTCSATMQTVYMDRVRTIRHCGRCGTMHSELAGHVDDVTPALVLRCREFALTPGFGTILNRRLWHQLGIAESIHVPADRPQPPE